MGRHGQAPAPPRRRGWPLEAVKVPRTCGLASAHERCCGTRSRSRRRGVQQMQPGLRRDQMIRRNADFPQPKPTAERSDPRVRLQYFTISQLKSRMKHTINAVPDTRRAGDRANPSHGMNRHWQNGASEATCTGSMSVPKTHIWTLKFHAGFCIPCELTLLDETWASLLPWKSATDDNVPDPIFLTAFNVRDDALAMIFENAMMKGSSLSAANTRIWL
jgi:hypothetical protein